MKRISVDQVVAGYERTGWEPMQGTWYQENDGVICACGLTAILGKEPSKPNTRGAAIEMELNPDYAIGFVDGFDDNGCNPQGYIDIDHTNYRIGHEDGQKAWTAVDPDAQK